MSSLKFFCVRYFAVGVCLSFRVLGWAAGDPKAQAVEPTVLARLKQRGFVCRISSVYSKRRYGRSSPQVFGPLKVDDKLSTSIDDNRLYLVEPKRLEPFIGLFGFDFKELKALSRDYLYLNYYESGITRKMEIKFATGLGHIDVDAVYDSVPLNQKTTVVQRANLEGCRLL